MNRLAPLLTALAALSACSASDDPQPVDGISQSEAEALDDAAAMIDERRMPEGVFEEGAEEGEESAEGATRETSE
jgi:hypothetical protein